jgi:hypothetical protein
MITRLHRYLFLITCILYSYHLQAQETQNDTIKLTKAWKIGGTGTVNFSQVSLSNWAAGGQNSLSVLGIADIYANYKKGKNTWDNTFTVTYGTVKLEDQPLRKSDDKLVLNLKYGRQASRNWFYSTQLNFRSQLTPTYSENKENIVSDFLAPAFLVASLGMDFKPSKKLSVFISPVTGKFTIVKDQLLADQGAFGVEPAQRNFLGEPIPGTGRNFRREFGGFVNVRFRDEVFENITLESKLDLFSNYLNNPENVDVNWENNFNFKVNKFISASLFIHMIYDDDIDILVDRNRDGKKENIGPKLQFKETLGIGLSYKFE